MDYRVPDLSIVFMCVAVLAGIAIPVVLLLVFRKKYKADILPFFIGCAVFIVFALIVEGTINRLILSSDAGKVIQGNVWLYAVFGGFMAGLFEETGRFTAYKTILKKKRDNNANALMYGAGHGGFEAFFLLSIGMISNIVTSVMLNAGMAGTLTAAVTDPATLQQMNAAFAGLASTAPPLFLVSIVERLAAVVLQVSLSVLVWFAAKSTKQFWLYPLAVLLHLVIDAVAVILATSGVNIWLVEGVVYVIAAISAVLAVTIWRRNRVVRDVGPEAEPA